MSYFCFQATDKGIHAVKMVVHLFKDLTDKGLGKTHFGDNVLEILQEKHDPSANIKPYLLASFGSAWAVIKVKRPGQRKRSCITTGSLESV